MKRLLVAVLVMFANGLVWAKAPLMPLYCYRFAELDAQGGIASENANFGTGTVALTKKLWETSTAVPATRDTMFMRMNGTARVRGTSPVARSR